MENQKGIIRTTRQLTKVKTWKVLLNSECATLNTITSNNKSERITPKPKGVKAQTPKPKGVKAQYALKIITSGLVV
jgi:hypothetical protein